MPEAIQSFIPLLHLCHELIHFVVWHRRSNAEVYDKLLSRLYAALVKVLLTVKVVLLRVQDRLL